MTRAMLEIELDATKNQLDLVKESYADAARAMIRMEDIGWSNLLTAATDKDQRWDVNTLHEVSEKLQEWTDTNPLLIRGNQVRCSYMFDGGFEVGSEDGKPAIPVRVQNLILDPVNQGAVFGNAALSINEKARFTDGQIFAIFNTGTSKFQSVPFRQITDAYTNPDDKGEVWYYLWTRSGRVANAQTAAFETRTVNTWIPVDTFTLPAGVAHPAKLGPHDVDTTRKIVDSRVNRVVGQTWGVADAFGAAPWALAYSSYLRDGTRVLSGLAEFIWQLKPKNKRQGDKAGASIRTTDGSAGTVITDMEMSSLPRANAVDLKTGRPIASQVAAALGISTVMLMSDSEQVGGSNTEASLQDPTIRTMADRRALNTEFLIRCVRLLGAKNPKINWSKMAPDSDYREMQLKTQALETGQFHPDETRAVIGKLAGFDLKHPNVPDGYLLPNNEKSLALKSIDSDASAVSSANGQGGASADATRTAKPSYGNNDLRDQG